MQSILYDAELWQGHAEHVRTLTKRVIDPRTREQMLTIAARFDRIADLATQLNISASRQNDRGLLGRLWRPAV